MESGSGQVAKDVPIFAFSKGFITEVSPLGYPPDSAVDINDFELLIDGTVKRRRALAAETGGSNYTLTSTNQANEWYNQYWSWTRWATSQGNTYIVVQIGYFLHFYTDSTTLSTAKATKLLDLRQFTANKTLQTEVITQRVSFCVGNGDLFVSSSRTDTFYIRENGANFDATAITPIIRSFIDDKDEIPPGYRPNNSTGEYTAAHRYNLRNRGWPDYITDTTSTSRDTGISRYTWETRVSDGRRFAPAKIAIPWRGYWNRNNDGIPTDWKSEAVEATSLGAAEAPRGHIKHDVYRQDKAHRHIQVQKATATSSWTAHRPVEPVNAFRISNWTDPSSPGYAWSGNSTFTVTLTLNYDITRGLGGSWNEFALPIAVEFEIVDNSYTYTVAHCPGITFRGSLDGIYSGSITAITARGATDAGSSTITFTYRAPYAFTSFTSRSERRGYVYLPWSNTQRLNYDGYLAEPELSLTTNSTATTSDRYRYAANAFYAGRLWLAHMNGNSATLNAFYADKLLFSRVILEDRDATHFYQASDPTEEIDNQLGAGDGGVLDIPGLGVVHRMMPIGNALYVFTSRGVWEVKGAQGFFAANDIVVRKISEVEINYDGFYNPNLVASIESTLVCISNRGLYTLVQDSNTGYMTLQSLTERTIQTFWNSISYSALKEAQLIYDEPLKRVTMLYRDTALPPVLHSNSYNAVLIFDMRLQSFYKYKLPTQNAGSTLPRVYSLAGAVVLANADSTNNKKKLKYFTIVDVAASSNYTLTICDFAQTTYNDYTTLESIPDCTVAWDSSPGDWSRKRQAPYIITYMRRTETGYSGSPYVPVNSSSLTMQARWDWTDETTTGKWSDPQQIYRKTRLFTPTSTSDLDGYPVVVCKNKVRGVGRSLQLYFQGANDVDAHLLGWTYHYKGNRRV